MTEHEWTVFSWPAIRHEWGYDARCTCGKEITSHDATILDTLMVDHLEEMTRLNELDDEERDHA